MVKRANGLDLCTPQYVQGQELIFMLFSRHIPNCTILRRPAGLDMQAWLDDATILVLEAVAFVGGLCRAVLSLEDLTHPTSE